MAKVVVYSIPHCPYCSELKELLVKENIEFVDIDVSLPENDKEFERIHKITKSDEVPIISVGKQLLVPNISFKTIREGLDITKKFLL
jgi:glutaredoxin